MNGLASSMAQEQQEPQPQEQQEAAQSQQQAGNLPTVEQVVQLLMQGNDPEKLEQAGIPRELIMQAISIIQQHMAAQQGGQQGVPQQDPAQQQQVDPGLAQQLTGG